MNPNDTTTPRTNDQLHDMTEYDGMVPHSDGDWVPANFARQLERELNESIAEVARLHILFKNLADEIECTSECDSHYGGSCDCDRIARAYAIVDQLNPETK
jgi:hypothetical protein